MEKNQEINYVNFIEKNLKKKKPQHIQDLIEKYPFTLLVEVFFMAAQ